MAILGTEITTLLDEDEQYYLLPRTVLKAIADDNGNYISSAITAAHINSIPNKLPKYSAGASDWDTAPVANSTKPVTSGGVYDAINAIMPSIVYMGADVDTGFTVTKKGLYMATFYAQVSGISAVGRHDISILKNVGGVTTYLSSDSIASGANYPCASCSCIAELEPLNQIVFGSYNPNDNPYLSLRTVVAFIGAVN